MRRFLTTLIACAATLATVAEADTRIKLGSGYLFTNDYLGDGKDRWRTFSLSGSHIYGRAWSGTLPEGFGDILEFRFKGEVVAPDNLVIPAAGDRPYAGNLSFGLHTHFQRGAIEFALGGDINVLGPQNKLDGVHSEFHDLFGSAPPSAIVRANQVEDSIVPAIVMEMGREYALGRTTNIRPFVEGRAGLETLVRAGFDVSFGNVGKGEILVRDPITGHRYRTNHDETPDTSFVVGADIAAVSDSELLPASSGVTIEDTRTRVRAGFHWQGQRTALFYGVSWLGEEFEQQDDSQVVGAIQLKFSF